MESTVERGFKRAVKPDGTILYTFTAHRTRAANISAGFLGLAIVLLSIIIGLATKQVWLAVVGPVVGLLVQFGFKTVEGQFTVVLGEGIKFNDQQVPFTDIQHYGVETGTTKWAELYLVTHGKRVAIATVEGHALAQALMSELAEEKYNELGRE